MAELGKCWEKEAKLLGLNDPDKVEAPVRKPIEFIVVHDLRPRQDEPAKLDDLVPDVPAPNEPPAKPDAVTPVNMAQESPQPPIQHAPVRKPLQFTVREARPRQDEPAKLDEVVPDVPAPNETPAKVDAPSLFFAGGDFKDAELPPPPAGDHLAVRGKNNVTVAAQSYRPQSGQRGFRQRIASRIKARLLTVDGAPAQAQDHRQDQEGACKLHRVS
jgi:hypothetical protein